MNQVLALDPSSLTILAKHNGKVIEITIKELHFSFFLVIRPEKIYVFSTYQPADAAISGSLLTLVKQLQTNADASKLRVAGDMELVQDLQRLIQNLDIDWQEYLSCIIGDVAANKVAYFMQQLKATTLIHKQRTLEDFREFLQEEQRFLPTCEEVEDFYEEIMALRNSIDRLEARLQRLTECQS
jgi:ubiquinone biosynthesis accessory factor UbiJ